MIDLNQIILEISGAHSIARVASVQTLWSGYGAIKRFFLEGGKYPSLIAKHIQLPNEDNHPRGWNTNLSHERKLKSYHVEQAWYEQYAHRTDEFCPVPKIYHTSKAGDELLLVMEDLDGTGYDIRVHHHEVTIEQAKTCLEWLAAFHAKFMNVTAPELWQQGTYWHLATRPDEWDTMANQPLKNAASAIDQKLAKSSFKTLVHGDAKLANFCFNQDHQVAAVDFQYVGMGCGMKDVAYFISSCFEESDCERLETKLLECYFKALEIRIDKSIEFQELKKEWQALYSFAWADFYRFLDGWSPGHWKMHTYSEQLTKQVIEKLKR